MIRVVTHFKGKSTNDFLKKLQKKKYLEHLNKYGEEGVKALSSVTPKDTGLTANSWYYEIEETKKGTAIYWCNSNVVKGYPIAILLEYGHGTGTGGYVQGRHYISPAIRPVFDKIARDAWNEVTNS